MGSTCWLIHVVFSLQKYALSSKMSKMLEFMTEHHGARGVGSSRNAGMAVWGSCGLSPDASFNNPKAAHIRDMTCQQNLRKIVHL